MIALHPLKSELATSKPGIVARIKEWFRFDIEALGNAGIAISALYGAPITYVPPDVEADAADKKQQDKREL